MRYVRIGLLVALLALGTLVVTFGTDATLPALERVAQGLGPLGPLFIVLLAIGQVVLAVVPSPLLLVLSIALYGPAGALLGYGALFISSLVGFGIGRWARVDVDEGWLDLVNRYGTLAVVVTRASPLLSLDAVSIASGALDMSKRRFVIATLVGLIPLCVLAYAYGRAVSEPNAALIVYTIVLLVVPVAFVVWDRNREP